MFNGSYTFHLLFLAVFFIALIHDAQSTADEETGRNEKGDRKLSRKRRYLIFPTGSSIQLGNIQTQVLHSKKLNWFYAFPLVYDATYTVPDYTLYITTGITVALAYGLPDKPTYPETELMERYENGSLPLIQYRTDKNVTGSSGDGEIKANSKLNTSSSSYTKYDYNGNDAVNRIANYYKYFQRRKPDSYYFGKSPFNPANYNRKVYCNNRNCAYHGNMSYYSNDKDNRQSSAYNSYNVRPPYSATVGAGSQYDAFTKYMSETYFKPWIETSFSQVKSTAIPTKPT